MKQKKTFKQMVSLEKIVLGLVKDDIEALNGLSNFGIDTTLEFEEKMNNLRSSDNLNDLISLLEEIFDDLVQEKEFELALIVQRFMQRYAYYLITNSNYLNYIEDLPSDIIKLGAGVAFENIFMPFFSKQLDYYLSNYVEALNKYPLEKWNENLKEKLVNQDIQNILLEKDFVVKLKKSEDLASFLQDSEKIYTEIKFDDQDTDKQNFLAQTNELKIILQSADVLIERVLDRLIWANKELEENEQKR